MYLDGSRQQILKWVAEGVSDARIAEQLRVSPSTVRCWRERNGVVRPPRVKKAETAHTPGDAASSGATSEDAAPES